MADQACRDSLNRLMDGRGNLDHPGLALARYLETQQDNNEGVRRLHERIVESQASDAYRKAFERWKGLAEKRGSIVFSVSLKGPLAIGLGNESVTEVGLTTHFTYGMPVIPGSAIKGLCRRGALLLKAQGKLLQEQFDALFGKPDSASLFTFWDAWYDPTSVNGKPFHRDVITVHHPDYYSRRGKADKDGKDKGWPTDFDDPNPVPFLVVKPKAQFLFAVDAPDEKWGEFVKELLRWSLANVGAGGKTNAGYGWFDRGSTQQGAESNVTTANAASRPSLAAGEELWPKAIVRRNPGSGALTAINRQTQERAVADSGSSQKLFNQLPESAREALKRKHDITADVTVSRMGNMVRIKAIHPRT